MAKNKLLAQLPNTYIIGAAKCGTTSIAETLRNHPDIYIPRRKEPVFWSDDLHFDKGIEMYAERYYEQASDFPVRIDASTHYLYWSEKVAPRLKSYYGSAPLKFIAIFREPVQRAYSMYWQLQRKYKAESDFGTAIRAEKALLNKHWEQLYSRGKQWYGLAKGSEYASNLKPFLANFPKRNFLFLLFDDLVNDFEETVNKITRFLKIPDMTNIPIVRSNPASIPRNLDFHHVLQGRIPPPLWLRLLAPSRTKRRKFLVNLNLRKINYPLLDSKLSTQLKNHFAPEVNQLSDIMGRDLSSWIKS